MQARIVGVFGADETVDEHRAGEAFGGFRRIVAERGEELAQTRRRLRMGGHAVELRLHLLRRNRHLPEVTQRSRLQQGIFGSLPE